jgi:hypothetical protein
MEENDYLYKVMRWVASDRLMILLTIVVLGACFFTLHSMGSYRDAINTAWSESWNESGCAYAPVVPAIPYNIEGDYSASENRNQNASRPGIGNGQTD